MQIKDFPQKNTIDNADLLLLQNASDNAYQSVTKQNLLAGLSFGGGDTSVDPIKSMPNLAADWSAEDVVVDANNLVSRINDTSGNNYHATQNNQANRATLVANALNNRPVLRFSTTQFYLHGNLLEPATILALIKNTGTGHRTVLGALSNTASALDAYYFKACEPNNILAFSRPNLSPPANSAAIIDDSRWFIFSGRLTDTLIEAFTNNQLRDRKTISGIKHSIDTNGIIGAGYYNGQVVDYFLGDIYRICMFSQPLSYSNLFTAINYLRNSLRI